MNQNVIDPDEVVQNYNDWISGGGYQRIYQDVSFASGGISTGLEFYRKQTGEADYSLLKNNCVTTSTDIVLKSRKITGNWKALQTLIMLENAVSPHEVDWILEVDYILYQGTGLVTPKISGENTK